MASFTGVFPAAARAMRTSPALASSSKAGFTVSRNLSTSTSALAPFARRPFVPARPSPSSLYSASSPTLRLARSFSLYPFASANKPSSPESSRPLEDALLEADVAEPVASAAAPVPPPAAASGPYSLTPSEAPAPPPALSLDTIDPATIPMEIGDLNALGLGGWWPIGIIQQLLEAVHVWTGMPWWLTIATVTFAIRSILLRFFISNIRTTAAMTKVQPELKEIADAMKQAKAVNDTGAVAHLNQKMLAVYQREKINPLAPLAMVLIQIPTFICFFLALKRMAALPVWQMTVQGIPNWCPDLTVADPTYILPIISAVSTAALMHVGATGVPPIAQTEMQYAMARFGRVAVLSMIPIAGGFTLPDWMPFFGGYTNEGFAAAILIYWSTSNLFAFLQSAALRIPSLRAKLRLASLPPLPTFPPGHRHRSFFEIMSEKLSLVQDETIAKRSAEELNRKKLEVAEAQRRFAAQQLEAQTQRRNVPRTSSILTSATPIQQAQAPAPAASQQQQQEPAAAPRYLRSTSPPPPPPSKTTRAPPANISAAAAKFLEERRRKQQPTK